MPNTSTTPVAVRPFPGDQTPDIEAILRECKSACPASEKSLLAAQELQDYFDGESEKFIPQKPAEDALSWLIRPKRVSFITSQAINKLTSHLYKPGPRHRRIANDPDVSGWYRRVAMDIQLNGVMQQADKLATLHGLCAIGIYPTGNPARPINFHMFPRQDFTFWTSPDDPRVATAVCTVTRMGHDKIRYRLWTHAAYYTFYKGKDFGYQPGGWGAAKYVPEHSDVHPYGVLPFTFITHQLPTTDLATPGLGYKLAKINRALNTDKSNLALWVHHYARPLGFVSGVSPEWRPKFIDGGFVPLTVKQSSTEDSPVVPEAHYLESSFDINAVCEYIRGEANMALAEIDVPLTLAKQSDGGGGSMAQSGFAIAAQDADLITYAKGRQPLAELWETDLATLICTIGASEPANPGAMQGPLLAAAADMSLRVGWPEVSIDLPGPARDLADTFELTYGLTDPIEQLMKRQGLTEDEAIEQYRRIQRRKAIALMLEADPLAIIPPSEPDDTEVDLPETDIDGDPLDSVAPDMGVAAPDSAEQPQSNSALGNIRVVNTINPQDPIPSAAILMPNVSPGNYGTES